MKILFSNDIFIGQRFGGISNYFMNLINKLPNRDVNLMPMVCCDNVYLMANGYQNSVIFKWLNMPKLVSLIHKMYKFIFIKYSHYDIFHPTYYSNYIVNYLPDNKKLVLTVYDMIHEKFPQFFNSSSMEYKCKQKLCERADLILAISETTKNDLIDIYKISPEKIKVIYLATDFKLISQVSNFINWLPEKYILFVGNRGGYKNFNWMLKNIAKVLIKQKIKLLVIGSKFNTAEIELINEYNVVDLVIQKNVIESYLLQEVYSRAQLFIFPSLYEGFGIPILEAFASKVPILLPNISCFPEIAGNGAAYYEADNEIDFRDKIYKLLDDRDLRLKLIDNGVERLEQFSWDKTANQTYKAYEELLNNGNK